MEYIAVLNDVSLAFLTQLTVIARASFTVEGDEVIIGNGFGLNETAFKIGVNDARRIRRRRPFIHRPGACFFRTDGKDCLLYTSDAADE